MDKEGYRVWREYLKRSKDYKDFCRQWRDKKQPGSNTLTRQKWNNFLGVFNFFGDVHKQSFNKWYKTYEARIKEHNERTKGNGIKNYSDIFKSDIYHVYDLFKERTGIEPTTHELIEYFANIMKIREKKSSDLILYVCPAGHETVELTEQFTEIVKKHKEKTKDLELFFKRNTKPTSKSKLKEIESYLKVYDMKKREPKTKWTVIASKIFRKELGIRTKQREAMRHYTKAKAIIRNVERGEFPGEYGLK